MDTTNTPRFARHRAAVERRLALLTGLGLVSAVLLLGGCGGRAPSEAFSPSWSPDGRAIAYIVDPDPSAGCPYGSCAARFELWVMGADGHGARKLARGVAGGQLPTWSPDGSTIAFEHSSDDTVGDVYTIRRDGTHLRRLTRTPWDDDFPAAWSPDGRKLLFVHWPLEGANRLYVMNADGTGLRRVSRLEAFEASWSPDGTRIAVTTFDGLFTVNARGGGLRRLVSTPHGGIDGKIAWSPDGDKLAFAAGGRLAVVDPNGRAVVPPARLGLTGNPVWSPHGPKIAFEGRPGIGIYLVDASEDRPRWRRLSATGAGPTWSPDGRRIAFSDDGEIHVTNADGTGAHALRSAAD